MGKLDGKVAVILGASSIEGLGGVIAKSYANEGAKVVISGRRQEPLDELETELNGKAQTCDITVDGDIENLFKVAKDTYGKVDIAINTTGMYEPGPLNELTRDHLRKYTEVSFIGPTIFISWMVSPTMLWTKVRTQTDLRSHLTQKNLMGWRIRTIRNQKQKTLRRKTTRLMTAITPTRRMTVHLW